MNYSKNHIKRISHKIVCSTPNKHSENHKTNGYNTKYHMWHKVLSKLLSSTKDVYRG